MLFSIVLPLAIKRFFYKRFETIEVHKIRAILFYFFPNILLFIACKCRLYKTETVHHMILDVSVVSHFCRPMALLHHICSPSHQLGYPFYFSQFQAKMLRNALRQSSRTVGVVSASSRAATVSLTTLGQNPKGFLFIPPYSNGRTAPVKHHLV